MESPHSTPHAGRLVERTPGSTEESGSVGVNAAAALMPDQALGLRLICLARAASAMHMAEACATVRSNCASDALRALGRSQAAGLLRLSASTASAGDRS